MIKVSAPTKVHLLGEHSVVYGKPAILTSVDLRVTVTISKNNHPVFNDLSTQLKKVIEPIVKKHLKIKKLPLYQIEINSKAPIGAGLGSSAAVSASYIGALLSFLKVEWDLETVNKLSFEAEKTFQGNPSGGDNSTVVNGGLIWFRKESPDLKIIHPLPFSISAKLSKNFLFINTGKPKEITAEMVSFVKNLYQKKPKVVESFLENQEKLVRALLPILKQGSEKEFVNIIREGEKNLESIGVVPKSVCELIRNIEQIGGAAKISGAGGRKTGAGIVLAYHKNQTKLLKVVKSYNLTYFKAKLGVEGLRQEQNK